MGYIEIQHTADWAIRVWAPDFPALLVQAAVAMYDLTETQLNTENRVERNLELAAGDHESLLVGFLSELLYLQEIEGLAFNQVEIHTTENELKGRLIGGPVLSQRKEIKAVTYHNLKIIKTPGGLEVTIVFDV